MSAYVNHRIAYYLNLGNGVFTSRIIVTESAMNARGVRAADIDVRH